jgi:hypothetical protein
MEENLAAITLHDEAEVFFVAVPLDDALPQSRPLSSTSTQSGQRVGVSTSNPMLACRR